MVDEVDGHLVSRVRPLAPHGMQGHCGLGVDEGGGVRMDAHDFGGVFAGLLKSLRCS